jgi:PAS domain-containing protein
MPEAAFKGVGLEGQLFYTAFSRSALSGWTMATGVPAGTVETELWRSTLAMVGGAFLCLGLAAGLAYYFGRRIAQSITRLADSAAQLSSVREHSSLPYSSSSNNIEEIETLGRALNESAVRSRQLERERAEQAERESEQRFRALVTASSDVLYQMSPDLRQIRELDKQGVVADPEAPRREWIQTSVPADDQPLVIATANEAIRTKSTYELEHRVLRADGSLGWMFARAVPVLDANGEIRDWFGAATDITERKHAEEALRSARSSAERAKGDAERANNAKDQFLAVLSHELRTPLSPVLAAAELLRRRLKSSPEASEPLEIIQRNVQLQARLIDDLLDLTRIANGKIELTRKPINICTIIERAVEIAKPDIEAPTALRGHIDRPAAPGLCRRLAPSAGGLEFTEQRCEVHPEGRLRGTAL